MTSRFLVSASLALALVACGGGDSDGSSPPTGGGGGGGTPTPSPSPSPTYLTLAQLTGARSFLTACAGNFGGQNIPIQGLGDSTPPPVGQGVSLRLSLSTDGAEGYRVRGNSLNNENFDVQFAPTDINAASPFTNLTDYVRPDGSGFNSRFLLGNKPIPGITREYVRNFVFIVRPRPSDPSSTYYCTYGVPTLLTDALPTSTITYTSFTVIGNAVTTVQGQLASFDLSESVVTLSANPATFQVSTQITFVGRQILGVGILSDTRTPLGTASGVTTLENNTQNFGGGLQGNFVVVGQSGFGGWFFGPQGREAGYGFGIDGQTPTGDPLIFTGAVTARR
jgi:hypothetical protein